MYDSSLYPVSSAVGPLGIYFETLNTASVGLHREETPSAAQPRIAVTYVSYMDWEDVAWSREIEVEEYGDYTGVAKLTTTDDGRVVYPNYMRHPIIPQPIDHNTVRVKVELGAAVPEGMTGTLHLAWYDPNNTLANLGTPETSGHGLRDNAASLSAAGGNLPGFTLEFTTDGPTETSDSVQKAYLAIDDARYGDNFIVVAHPNEGIAETFEFRENGSQPLVLMRPANTGLWHALPDEFGNDYRTTVLTILPSVDVDCDSDNTADSPAQGIERSDWEEEIENEEDYDGKRVAFNSDDDNENGVRDCLEFPGATGWMSFSDDDLVQVILDRGFDDLSGMNGFVFELKVTIDRGLKYWLSPETSAISDSGCTVQTITENNHQKAVYRWQVAAGAVNYPQAIYVEGIDPTASTDTILWRLVKTAEQVVDQDAAKLTDPYATFDLDIDSNNNGTVEPDDDKIEDYYECYLDPGKNQKYALGAIIEPGLEQREQVIITIPKNYYSKATSWMRFELQNYAAITGGLISLWSGADASAAQVPLDTSLQISTIKDPAVYQWASVSIGGELVGYRLTLWVQGESQNHVDHPVENVEQNVKPGTALRLTLGDEYGSVRPDRVSYIVAAENTFWHEFAFQQDVRCGLASNAVYTPSDKPNYCLQMINDEREVVQLGFTNTIIDKNLLGKLKIPFTAKVFDVLGALSGRLDEEHDLHGLGVRLYKDYVSHQYVLAFEGSNLPIHDHLNDWAANNLAQGIGAGTFAKQYVMAYAIGGSIRAARNLGKLEKVVITGHSLGGGLAALASYATANLAEPVNQVPATTFNSADVVLTDVNFGLSQLRSENRITAYIVVDEFLDGLQRQLGNFKAEGRRVSVTVESTTDSIEKHKRYLEGLMRYLYGQ